MKQFFEQYGGVALGILALLVLIAMITPVGNIIKTSLQGTVQTFSTRIEEQQTDTIDIDMGRFSSTKTPINLFANKVGTIWDSDFGTCAFDEATNTYTINKTVYHDEWSYPYGLVFRNTQLIKDNVYLVVFEFNSTATNRVYWEFPGYFEFTDEVLTIGEYNEPGNWIKYSYLLKAPITASGSVILKQHNNIATETRKYRSVQFYNLTDLYGAGNEPTTKEQAMEELYL